MLLLLHCFALLYINHPPLLRPVASSSTNGFTQLAILLPYTCMADIMKLSLASFCKVPTWWPTIGPGVDRGLLHGGQAPLALNGQLQVLGQRLPAAQDLVGQDLGTKLLQLDGAEGGRPAARLPHGLRVHGDHRARLRAGRGHLGRRRAPA